MEITKTNSGTPARPNDAEVLSHVLWAVCHMVENGQITRQAPALFNIMEEIEGYDSGDMCSVRQVLLGHAVEYGTDSCVPLGLIEPVDLWDKDTALAAIKEHDFTPPFADPNDPWNQPSPPAEPDADPIDEFYLKRSQVSLIEEALDAWAIAKGENLTEQDRERLWELGEHLA